MIIKGLVRGALLKFQAQSCLRVLHFLRGAGGGTLVVSLALVSSASLEEMAARENPGDLSAVRMNERAGEMERGREGPLLAKRRQLSTARSERLKEERSGRIIIIDGGTKTREKRNVWRLESEESGLLFCPD